jgi:hypothetical protein
MEDSSLNKNQELLAANNQVKNSQKNENDDERFEFKLNYESELVVVPT